MSLLAVPTMRIITNADDFGLDDDTTRATIECLDARALTSATIMPAMPATQQAIDYAIAHADRSFGVHLTYVTDTLERPLSDPQTIPTLVTPEGKFHPSNTLRMSALRGRVAAADIERETAAQLQRLVGAGVRISHVDSHGHLHKFAPFRKALAAVLPRFGIAKVRGVQNLYLHPPYKSPTYYLGFWWNRKLASRFTCPRQFYMPTSEAPSADWPVNLLPRLKGDGTIEVGVHPGYAERWRDGERKTIQEFAKLARQSGHQLITWNDL